MPAVSSWISLGSSHRILPTVPLIPQLIPESLGSFSLVTDIYPFLTPTSKLTHSLQEMS